MGFQEFENGLAIEFAASLDDLDDAELVGGDYEINGFLVPEEFAPEYSGVNSSEMELCCTTDKEWYFTKPVSANYGRAGKGALMASLLYDRLEIDSPDIGIADERLFIEHLGRLEKPHGNQEIDSEDLERAVAAKVIAGDPDIGGNIGIKDGECYVYDFDQAGGPVNDQLKRNVSRLHYADISKIDKLARSMVSDLDVDDYISELESNLDRYLHGAYGFNDLDVRTVYNNLECFRDGEVSDLLSSESL